MPALDYEKLAEFYDALVGEGPDQAFFVEEAARAGGPVAELMAGTGRISLPLAASGAELTCVDSSAAMLALLRRKLEARELRARLIRQDVAALDLAVRPALAFIGYCSFEEIRGEADRKECLRRIFRHLVPGGRFICTLHDPEIRLASVGPGRDLRRRFTDPRSGRELEIRLATAFDEKARLVRGTQSIVDAATAERLLELPLIFRLSDRAEFERLARGAGFRVEDLHGDYRRHPYAEGQSAEMIWILSKPEGP